METSESLADYRQRWHDLLPAPATSVWSSGATEAELTALADSVVECTCDTMLLMRAGCQCGQRVAPQGEAR